MTGATTPASTRVWIDDVHAILRRGMAASLASEGFSIAGESSGLRPIPTGDVAVLVFECTPATLRAALHLRETRKLLLVATVQVEREDEICRLLEGGVRAVLPRSALTVESLVATIRAVLSGAATAPAHLMVRTLAHARQEGLGPTGGLSERERAVLRLLAEGSDTLEMAQELSFSERTVKNVVHDILMKLNCRTRAHAVALATRSGVI